MSPKLAEFLESTGLPPYDVPARLGELKFVHVIEARDAGDGRRGIGAGLAAMPAYEVRQARPFDMFPHTGHMEVAVLLTRDG